MSKSMSKLPKISIITPSFNSVTTIRDTIESVQRQDYPDVEHIVVDGGSTDGTLDVLGEYPHLIWESEKDEGHYDAMNKGVRRASGEVVNILNADDCFRPGALTKVGEAFRDHPDWDALFGDIVYVDAEGNEIYRREEAVYDYRVIVHSGVCYVNHQTLFVKKTIHDELGYYDHRRYLNVCDMDFILKLGQAGKMVGHVPALLVDYRYHDRGQSADLRVTANMLRESLEIRRGHGLREGYVGRVAKNYYRLKRQWQKLTHRGRCDLVPGRWALRKHMKESTNFTSNTAGLEDL